MQTKIEYLRTFKPRALISKCGSFTYINYIFLAVTNSLKGFCVPGISVFVSLGLLWGELSVTIAEAIEQLKAYLRSILSL